MKKSFLLMLSCLFVLGVFAQTQEESSFDVVKSGCYTFEASSLTSQGGFHKTLTSEYSMTVNGDDAKAHLPYVGEAYSAPMSGNGGIEFDGAMQDYATKITSKKKEKNDQIIVTFQVKGEDDTYKCTLSVSKSGSATLSVNSTNRNSISYSGMVVSAAE